MHPINENESQYGTESGREASNRRRELRIQLCRTVSRLAGHDPRSDNAVAISHVALALAALLDHCREMAVHARKHPNYQPHGWHEKPEQ